MAKLGEYVTIRNGKLDANAAIENGKYPFFTCSVTPLRIDNFSYDCECVLVAGNGDLNVKYYNGKFDAYQRTYIIESNDKTLLTVPYLYFFLEKYIETLRKQSIGGIIKYIKLCNLTNAEIPLCGINKQNQITTVLSKLNSIIEIQKKQLLKLDELIKSRFIEMFGENSNKRETSLSKIAEITGGLTKSSKRSTFKVKMPYLRVANVFFNKLNLDEILEIGVRPEEIEKTTLQKGDLLFVEGNGSVEQIGRVAIWDGSIEPCLHQNHLIKARFLDKNITPEYALFYFMSQEGRQQIVQKSVSTSGLNTLSVNKIGSLMISVPPINLQIQFTEFLQQVDKSKFECSISLNFLKSFNFYKNF